MPQNTGFYATKGHEILKSLELKLKKIQVIYISLGRRLYKSILRHVTCVNFNILLSKLTHVT